ncbi:MAG: 3-deoxy-7-phosphoheptulonate synthase [Planctomycetes bacterium]|nr:3-deoxy-7-phosphoheptulonate synthase [Planctomycetota bacterium]
MRTTADLHVVSTVPIATPDELQTRLPLGETSAELVHLTRERIRAILHGEDRRILAVVGPCSIHDVAAARDYGQRLVRLRAELADHVEVVMRVYFEKPRTTTGWKGLINDPHLDGTFDMDTGLLQARSLLLDLVAMGMPAATELLDPVVPQYLADLISWTAIGARTTESQTHRAMASGLSMPVGFKNGTDGDTAVARNAMVAAQASHHFLGVDRAGRVSVVRTTGNPDGHLVLRGGRQGPNFGREAVARAAAELAAAKLCPRVMIDCSHDNAAKDHRRQAAVCSDIAGQLADGHPAVAGVMIESNLVEGRQNVPADRRALVYGQSITDACVDFPTTERMLRELAGAVDRTVQRA